MIVVPRLAQSPSIPRARSAPAWPRCRPTTAAFPAGPHRGPAARARHRFAARLHPQGPPGLAGPGHPPRLRCQLPPDPDVPAEQRALEEAKERLNTLSSPSWNRGGQEISASRSSNPPSCSPKEGEAAQPGVRPHRHPHPGGLPRQELATLHARKLDWSAAARRKEEVELRLRRLEEGSSRCAASGPLYRAALITLSETGAAGESARLALEYAVTGPLGPRVRAADAAHARRRHAADARLRRPAHRRGLGERQLSLSTREPAPARGRAGAQGPAHRPAPAASGTLGLARAASGAGRALRRLRRRGRPCPSQPLPRTRGPAGAPGTRARTGASPEEPMAQRDPPRRAVRSLAQRWLPQPMAEMRQPRAPGPRPLP